jgi:hypothetical protein
MDNPLQHIFALLLQFGIHRERASAEIVWKGTTLTANYSRVREQRKSL